MPYIPTGRPSGRPKKSDEAKRRIGNPGGRPLAPIEARAPSAEPTEPAEPHRLLGLHGRALWERCQRAPWIKATDLELLLMTCEQMDERQMLRPTVFRDSGRFERAALRTLERQIAANLSMLGFDPESRERLGAQAVPAEPDQLAILRAARHNPTG